MHAPYPSAPVAVERVGSDIRFDILRTLVEIVIDPQKFTCFLEILRNIRSAGPGNVPKDRGFQF